MKATRLKPLGDCVLVEEETFKPYHEHMGFKHIVVPDKFEHGPKDRNPWGKVLELGSDCNGDVKRGDRVTWGKWAGARFDYRNRIFVLVREYDILGIDVKS